MRFNIFGFEEYMVKDRFTEEMYALLPVWDGLYEEYTGEYRIFLVENGICRRCNSKLAWRSELNSIFPENQYIIVGKGDLVVSSDYRLRFT